jgi:NitT/TauT family transport system permease protein
MTMARRLRLVLPPLAVGVGLLVAWELFVDWRDIKPFLLPKPSAIWAQIRNDGSELWDAAKVTGTNALVGLVIGSALGVLAALVASRFKGVSEVLSPLALAVNAMPIIALVPIFNNIFSTTSAIPRRLMVTIIVFFPMFLNTLRGLLQPDPTKVELMRSYAASGWETMRKVRLPNALPFTFTGLKIAASLAVIAAVVAEYFGGVQNGLGYRIAQAAGSTRYPDAWAYVAASCLLGLTFYVAVVALERVVMPWRAARSS